MNKFEKSKVDKSRKQVKTQKVKTGGRKRGTPNKATADLRKWLSVLIDSNLKTFEADMKKILPAQRLSLLEKLMQYCIPKMQSVDANVDLTRLSDEEIEIIVNNILNKIEDENSN